MIDMKLQPGQAAPENLLMGDSQEAGPTYPEGLRIELEGESLKRMAMGEGNLPHVGQKFRLVAMAEVVEVCKDETQTEAGYCVEMQIQALELGDPEQLNDQQKAYNQVTQIYGKR
jgi:hypothetical protein